MRDRIAAPPGPRAMSGPKAAATAASPPAKPSKSRLHPTGGTDSMAGTEVLATFLERVFSRRGSLPFS